MRRFIVCTRAEAPRLQRLVRWLTGIPVKGVGEIVEQNPPDPDARNILGWATRYQDFYRYPGNTGASTDQFALELTQPITDAWKAREAELHALIGDTKFTGLQTWIQNHMTSAADLPADWNIKDQDGNDVLDNSEDVVPDAAL